MKVFYSQKGAFSPFMFGMLMGVAIFSTIVSHWIRKEVKLETERRLVVEQQKVEDISNALESSILSENVNVIGNKFSTDLTLSRAKRFATRTTGKTRSGEDYQLQTARGSINTGIETQRVLITSTDDEYLKSETGRYISADSMSYLGGDKTSPTALFDSGAVRTKQIEKSIEYMNMLASQVYLLYSRDDKFSFPTNIEFNDLSSGMGLRTVWGEPFSYTRIDETHAKLEFSTPWGHTEHINLKMDP